MRPIWLLQKVLESKPWRRMSRGQRSGDGDLARVPEVRRCRCLGSRMPVPARVYIVDRTHEILMSVLCAPRATVMSGTVQRTVETALTKRYEALLRVSQTLISVRSSEELFSILARELRGVVNFYVMGVGIYDEKTHEMDTKSYGEPGIPLQAPKFAPEETFSWWVYQHQQPLIIPSLDAEVRFPAVAEMLKNRGVRSVCVLPLTTVHRRLGGLAVGSIKANAYSSEEVSFLSLVANQVALAVDDALNFDASQHAKEALRASEESFRQIVDSMPAFAWCASPDGKLEYLNRRIVDYTAARQEDLVGFGWANVLHPQDVERTKKAWLDSVETGEPCDVEQRVRRFDNIYRWFRTVAQPMRDHSGRVIRWYGVATDIEDWKRAEEALRAAISERTRLSAVRADIGMALARKDSLREILRACTEAMVQHLDAAFARIWTLNSDGGELELQASAGMYTRLDGRYSRIPLGEIKIGLIAQNRKAHLTNDVQNDPRISDKDWARAEKITSFAGYPLVVEDRTVGVMGMFSQIPLTQSTLDTLSFLADGIAQGIERKHAEEKLRRSEAYLAEAQKLSHTGSFGWDVSSGEIYWSRETFRIFDYEPTAKVPIELVLQRTHPDDRSAVQQLIACVSRERTEFDFEHRLQMPDGSVKYLQVVGRPSKDEWGGFEFVRRVSTTLRHSGLEFSEYFRLSFVVC
jgi:PAS domain S-box-containing protein